MQRTQNHRAEQPVQPRHFPFDEPLNPQWLDVVEDNSEHGWSLWDSARIAQDLAEQSALSPDTHELTNALTHESTQALTPRPFSHVSGH